MLAAHSIAGRAPHCVVRLGDPTSSNDHASIIWTGEHWEVRDLGSTNGTRINGVALVPKQSVELAIGTVVRFGTNEERWELVDERGPVAMAHCSITGEERVAEDGLLVLPDATEVGLTIAADCTGAFFAETADGCRIVVHDGTPVVVANRTWVLRLPPASPAMGTYKQANRISLATLHLRFYVSLNEEHVGVEIIDGETVREIKPRTFLYVLLLLARQRLRDIAASSTSAEEQGWYDARQLVRDSQENERTMNLAIFRIREAFAKLGVEDADQVVERRRGQLRIGTHRLEERRG